MWVKNDMTFRNGPTKEAMLTSTPLFSMSFVVRDEGVSNLVENGTFCFPYVILYLCFLKERCHLIQAQTLVQGMWQCKTFESWDEQASATPHPCSQTNFRHVTDVLRLASLESLYGRAEEQRKQRPNQVSLAEEIANEYASPAHDINRRAIDATFTPIGRHRPVTFNLVPDTVTCTRFARRSGERFIPKLPTLPITSSLRKSTGMLRVY
jgi:hypothetical protein